MALKHAFRRNESVISMYGTLKFNEHGFLTNIEELDASEAQLLELPNIIDGATFKDDRIEPTTAPTDEEGGNGTGGKDTPPTDEEYSAYILELHASATEAQINSEGYLEMDFLNEKLRGKGWPILSGTKRKKLTDAARATLDSKIVTQPVDNSGEGTGDTGAGGEDNTGSDEGDGADNSEG